jgi:hypothetical protein
VRGLFDWADPTSYLDEGGMHSDSEGVKPHDLLEHLIFMPLLYSLPAACWGSWVASTGDRESLAATCSRSGCCRREACPLVGEEVWLVP